MLLKVKKPGRYIGGEYGSVVKKNKDNLRIVLSYPDLYEIGMSNQAIKLLYSYFNSFDNVSCERVFAPDIDLEKELKKNNRLLFSLETKTALNQFDIAGFSIGYELNFTNILNILALGGIPLHNVERKKCDPIVLAGGPAVSNPIPYGDFIDCIFIGEAEVWIFDAFKELIQLKQKKASRREKIDFLLSLPYFWNKDKKTNVQRAVWTGFPNQFYELDFPVPNVKIVQDHGSVEIMRGCPNGCRFCQAGYFFRPFRQKKQSIIVKEIDRMIFHSGFREITLSSLSSGDYKNLDKLVGCLNHAYSPLNASFSLPSLKINTFTLPLLNELSMIRKSGLTFAIEAPDDYTQAAINKKASLEKTIQILQKAVNCGWHLAKFYFMLGLPVQQKEKEEILIVSFLKEIKKHVKIKINMNIAGFIPKPHTPFQWASQLPEEIVLKKINYIKTELKKYGIKVSYHSPFASLLEGIISRGDNRAGELVKEVYFAGGRLDGWQEYLNHDLWKQVIDRASWDVRREALRERDIDEELPWDNINTGVSKAYLKEEYRRSGEKVFTKSCEIECKDHCGVCGKSIKVIENNKEDEVSIIRVKINKGHFKRLLVQFRKDIPAIFLSHLNIKTIFERTLLRSGYFARFSEGYNPQPYIQFASPLMLGVFSECELFGCELYNFDTDVKFIKKMNRYLPEGLSLTRVKGLTLIPQENKFPSLMSLYWGSDYDIFLNNNNQFKDKYQKKCFSFIEMLETHPIYFKNNGPLVSLSLCQQKISVKMSVRIKKTDKKGGNIKNVMNVILGDDIPLSDLIIIRKEVFARNADNEPGDYFSQLG